MTGSPKPQFDIPNEMRAIAERSVEQAKAAFQQLMQAAEESVSTLGRGETSQALDISKKAMHFAECNVLSAFELAEKIVQTKDIQELVRMQTEFLQAQMRALGEQVKDLGETASKAAMDTERSKTQPSSATTTKAMISFAGISPTSLPPTTSPSASKPSPASRRTNTSAKSGWRTQSASRPTRSITPRDCTP